MGGVRLECNYCYTCLGGVSDPNVKNVTLFLMKASLMQYFQTGI